MVQVIYEITWACPCKCRFCTVPKSSFNYVVPTTEYEKVLRLFKRYFRCDLAVVISGGEPSIVPNLRDYVDIARGLGYEVTIVTNGYNAGNVLRAEPDLIEVSIDYFGESHDKVRGVEGLFSRAMGLVFRASMRGIPVVVRSTAMRGNIDDLLKMREYMDGNGLRDVPILVMPVRGSPELKPSKQQLLELVRRDGIYISNNCPAGISSFVVTPEREVLACIFYRKKLGRLRRITKRELDKVVVEGAKIPRYPCENPT